MDNSPNHRIRRIIIPVAILVLIIVVIVGASNWSAIGTKLATPLRSVLGVRAVAQLETVLFNFQDSVDQIKYRAGLAEPEIPWDIALSSENSDPSQDSSSQATQPVVPTQTPTEDSNPTATSDPLTIDGDEQDIGPQSTPSPIVTPTPQYWTLPNIEPFGDLAGEGIWQAYISTPDGEIVALRTFLQPDPERPYTIVAITAFDLSKTNLHFVLGLKEPSKPGGPHGYGLIPADDKAPGKLLAAFNGGFIAEHGHYGAMADGVVALAASSGLATLAINPGGEVRIGEWGDDFYVDSDYRSWRQNALMIIHNGERNPKVDTGTWIEWGANLDGATVTLRSSVGLSEDNSVLYYFAGPNLSMPVLADAMLVTGVHNGMLLDINPSHAHFTAMRVVDGEMVAEPLYPEVMDLWVDRYLRQWDQDFFYITTRE